MYKIPVYQPSLEGNEKKYVNQCLDSSWISSKGEFVSRFEKSFASFVGVNHATTVSNGTTALHLALMTLGICDTDEVIVPTLTYIASVNAIAYTGATPVFVDSLIDSWQMDPKDVESKITSKTKAIIAVHLYGHPCEMDLLVAICKKHNLFLIEDCAEAIGTIYKGKHVGAFGDISTFSFFGNKTITTGEGGMVVTNDDTLNDRAVHFKGQGLAKHRQYWHDVIGYNYRMTNICAAIGLAQLENISTILKEKKRVAETYMEKLQNSPVECHKQIGDDIYHSYWMFSILTSDSKQRDSLRNFLEKEGVETRPLFFPVHTMPMYSIQYQRHPIAENLGWRGINLPSYPGLTDDEIDFICNLIIQYFKEL